MISGIGIDILSLPRFTQFVRRRGAGKVARRILTSGEMERFVKIQSSSSPSLGSSLGFLEKGKDAGKEEKEGDEDLIQKQVKFLSSRWCIKEAAYKSLTPLLPRPPSWKSFHLAHSPSGQPSLDIVQLPGPGLPGLGGGGGGGGGERWRLMATLSHDAGVVVGVVVALDKQFGI
ncbi:hypothetical protein L202_01919 [Cryptococcus amylolentus CBS 6039]|uniref:4'-phosphopantetheinyl transferase domain-containing protein n=2 Tax=Cryptococcus amylolentus TaxID=104669 RepID=A0A1E3HYZ8_9TREE|nr:hypothetical protein L202_01919 [Cryptococcus amylolentus CBS 6039]ODN81497.1 hypothetical protein L202_01919 [Cryptococcus amylolentus CBS 6039]ODO10270.1 hypothetical protein I350_02499 [Cryptococcus amylolentus CBS 6273]